MIDIDALKRDKRPQSSTIVHALIDRLEAAEEERDTYKAVCKEWIAKTEWVQDELNSRKLSGKYLGMHRADGIKVEIDALREREAALMAKLEAAEKERDAMRADKATLQQMMYSLKDRLEVAESEALEEARLNGMGSERELALMAKLEAAEKERDALRAKVAEMERQGPVAKVESWTNGSYTRHYKLKWLRDVGEGAALYALPGAKPQPSVPDTYAAGINAVAAMLQSKAAEYAKEHGHDDMGGLSFGSGMGGEIKMDYYTNLIELADDVRAMIAAAPEAKP